MLENSVFFLLRRRSIMFAFVSQKKNTNIKYLYFHAFLYRIGELIYMTYVITIFLLFEFLVNSYQNEKNLVG